MRKDLGQHLELLDPRVVDAVFAAVDERLPPEPRSAAVAVGVAVTVRVALLAAVIIVGVAEVRPVCADALRCSLRPSLPLAICTALAMVSLSSEQRCSSPS